MAVTTFYGSVVEIRQTERGVIMPKPSPGELIAAAHRKLREAVPDQFEAFCEAIGSVNRAGDYVPTGENESVLNCCREAIETLEKIKAQFPLKEMQNQRRVLKALEKLRGAVAQLQPKKSLID